MMSDDVAAPLVVEALFFSLSGEGGRLQHTLHFFEVQGLSPPLPFHLLDFMEGTCLSESAEGFCHCSLSLTVLLWECI